MRSRRWLIGAGAAAALIAVVVLFVPPVRSAAAGGLRYLHRVGPADARICLCRPDAEAEVTTSRGLALPVSLYRPPEGETRGTIVLVHGNTPSGRQHPFYRVLGARLSDRGFTVAAPDLGGFGGSENPFELEDEPGYLFSDDVRAVTRSFREGDPRGAARSGSETLLLVGHSMGATPALRVGLTESAVDGVVAIGPPRRNRERMASRDDRSYFWNRAQRTHAEVYGSAYPDWFTEEEWLSVKMREAMENLLPLLRKRGHAPVLFMDGSLENSADLRYLEEYVAGLAPPVTHHRVVGSDHYANVEGAGDVALYDDRAVGETVDVIADWVRTSVVPGG